MDRLPTGAGADVVLRARATLWDPLWNPLWHPLRHRLATTALDVAREVLRWAYVGPEDTERLGFAAFGERTLIEQPYKVLLGHEYMTIGSDTLIAAGAILAAWPDSTDARRTDDRPVLRIGDRVWGARGLSIVAHLDIEVGDDVWFGPNVYVTDAGHDASDLDTPIGLAMEPAEPVSIGAGSWIGTGAVILPGVTIGEHVVIGANSVVSHDIPSNSIAVGSPARVIRNLDTDDDNGDVDPNGSTEHEARPNRDSTRERTEQQR